MVKKIGIVLLIIIGGFAVTTWIISEPKPVGEKGTKAEAMAHGMLKTLNVEAWEDLDEVSWSFKGIHHYTWNKTNNQVEVVWAEMKVKLNLDNNTGQVYREGKEVNDTGEIEKAVSYFYNDSFWLVAPYKVLDSGTERSIVSTDEGEALMVTYTSGGVTPGDSYLWFLDEKGFPYKYKMWVNIIPVGGLEFTWEDWKQFEGGVWLSQLHKGLIDIELSGIKTK